MLILESLRREDNTMMGKREDRGKWAEGLTVKDLTQESADVVFHAGCHISFNEELWKVGRTSVNLLQKLGLDVGIMGRDETCCGCKAYDMGYRDDSKETMAALAQAMFALASTSSLTKLPLTKRRLWSVYLY